MLFDSRNPSVGRRDLRAEQTRKSGATLIATEIVQGTPTRGMNSTKVTQSPRSDSQPNGWVYPHLGKQIITKSGLGELPFSRQFGTAFQDEFGSSRFKALGRLGPVKSDAQTARD
jgi:hypothetical protein